VVTTAVKDVMQMGKVLHSPYRRPSSVALTNPAAECFASIRIGSQRAFVVRCDQLRQVFREEADI
jgi:hypothetical protein